MLRLRKAGLTLLVLGLSSFFGVQAWAQNVIRAGDRDNFGDWFDPNNPNDPDYLVIRPPLAQWLARDGGNNHEYHGRFHMPFDMDTRAEVEQFPPHGNHWDVGNWDFGYSFLNLPTLGADAVLRIRLKALELAPGNDGLWLQYTGDGSGFSSLYGVGLGKLDGFFGGNGNWYPTGKVAVFDLPLANLPPVGSGDYNLIDDINAAGYLDVVVMDDTAVDWIEVVVPEPGSLSLLLLGLPVLRRRS